MSSIDQFHNPQGGKEWRMTSEGIEVKDEGVIRTKGKPLSVKYLWEDFGDHYSHACYGLDVPVGMPVATTCVESAYKDDSLHRDPKSDRKEPGYVSDEETPHLRSPGLMQTLLSTAQRMADKYDLFGDTKITTEMLFDPFYSIMCGTAYIANQIERYGEDPPLVWPSYNAGSVRDSSENKWKMMTYHPDYIDRCIKYYNDFHALIRDGEIEIEDNLRLLTE